MGVTSVPETTSGGVRTPGAASRKRAAAPAGEAGAAAPAPASRASLIPYMGCSTAATASRRGTTRRMSDVPPPRKIVSLTWRVRACLPSVVGVRMVDSDGR